jgi:hypothetical protein
MARNENGTIKKGTILNKNGRPKGTPNRTTTEIREAYQQLISGNIEQLNEDLTALEPFQRLKIVIEMSKYILPTLRATDLKVGDNGFNPITISFQE